MGWYQRGLWDAAPAACYACRGTDHNFYYDFYNKLLFQPIIRTLDNRKEVIVKSQKRVVQVEGEVERLKQDFQQKLNEVRSEVLHLRNVGHEKGLASRESMILEERKNLQEEFENNFDELSKEIKATKTSFAKLNKELSAAISKQLLS